MNATHLRKLAFAMLLAAASLATAGSDSPAPEVAIEARQEGFKKMGAAMRLVTNALKTPAPDLAALGAPARDIGIVAAGIKGWFPAGSDADTARDTDALPYIWKARDRFDAAADQLVVEARALVTALEGGQVEAVRAQARQVSAACAACHRSFRAD
jgi:cytochrome c556